MPHPTAGICNTSLVSIWLLTQTRQGMRTQRHVQRTKHISGSALAERRECVLVPGGVQAVLLNSPLTTEAIGLIMTASVEVSC